MVLKLKGDGFLSFKGFDSLEPERNGLAAAEAPAEKKGFAGLRTRGGFASFSTEVGSVFFSTMGSTFTITGSTFATTGSILTTTGSYSNASISTTFFSFDSTFSGILTYSFLFSSGTFTSSTFLITLLISSVLSLFRFPKQGITGFGATLKISTG